VSDGYLREGTTLCQPGYESRWVDAWLYNGGGKIFEGLLTGEATTAPSDTPSTVLSRRVNGLRSGHESHLYQWGLQINLHIL